jgi:hypothetical protein
MDNQSIATKETTQLSDEYQAKHVQPWSRFFARFIDIYAFGFILGILSAVFYPNLFSGKAAADGVIVLFFWFLAEPIFLCTIGTTLGKYLFSITLHTLSGEKLKFYNAFTRSFWVWCAGYGFGIPLVNLFTLVSSYSRLKNTGITSWDKGKFIVTHNNRGLIKHVTSLLIITLIIALQIWDFSEKIQSPNKDFLLQKNEKDIEKENESLPVMVDAATELFKMHFKNNTLIYQYRLIAINKKDINPEMYYAYIKKQIMAKACNKADPNNSLAKGYNLSFDYFDKNKTPITTVTIHPVDCK